MTASASRLATGALSPVVAGPSPRTMTDIRFVVLVVAVLTSSVVAFGAVYLALPSTEQLDVTTLQPCLRQIGPATAALPDYERAMAAGHLMRQCSRPFFHGQATLVAWALVMQIAVVGLLYALHPFWLARRRRLTRLSGAANADVLRDLDGMAREAGLSRSPRWLIAPYAATHGGQAFGLPGRRRVCLDLGLLVRFDTDRAGFRAVVRHELAHLSNRDIDRTYLTIAAWWSFVLVALVPFVVLSLNPQALRRPLSLSSMTISGDPARWGHRFATLLALAVVVYLARNAILRVREIHADVTAARWDVDGALPRVVGALPWPTDGGRRQRLRSRLGSHPDPARRVGVMSEPALLSRTGGWEMAGLGLTVGIGLHNVSLLAGNLFGAYLQPGLLLIALPIGAILIWSLATAVRPPAPDDAWRRALLAPLATAAGFAASGPLAVQSADLNPTGIASDQADATMLAGNTTLLVVGALLLTAWIRSANRALDERPDLTTSRRRYRTVTKGTVIAVGAPLFAVWYLCTFAGLLGHGRLGGLPLTGWDVGWYRALAEWTGVFWLPQGHLSQTPIASAGLVLLWVVPAVLLRWWRGTAVKVGFTLGVGACAGLTAIAFGLALPYMAHAILPLDIRQLPEDMTVEAAPASFAGVYYRTYLIIAVLAQAAAAAVVAARARHRPVLVPLAVTVTAVLATLGLYASWAMSSCIQLTGTPSGVPMARTCDPTLALLDANVAYHLHQVLSWGTAAALPAAVVGAAISFLQRRQIIENVEPVQAPMPARRLTTAVLGLLSVLVLTGAGAQATAHYQYWKPNPVPTPPPPPPPPPPATDPCLTGAWRESSHRTNMAPFGTEQAQFSSSGARQTFGADGVAILDFGTGVSESALMRGRRVEFVQAGRITVNYRAAGGTIYYSDDSIEGTLTMTLKIDGKVIRTREVPSVLSNDRYTCAGDTLRQSPPDPEDGSYRIELRRIGS